MTATITPPALAFHAQATTANVNGLFSSYNNEISKHILEGDYLHPSLAGATNLLGLSTSWPTLVKRGATDGGIAVGPTSISAHATTDALLTLLAATGQTNYYLRGVENGTQKWLIDAAGNFVGNQWQGAVVGTTGSFSGALTFNGGKTPIATDGSNASSGTLPFALLADLFPAASGVDRVVTVKAGSFLATVSAQVQQITVAQQTITIASPVGNFQWTCLYYDNTGTLNASAGTLGGAKTTAPAPTSAAYVVGWVFMRAGATAIVQTDDSVASHGYIVPQNVNGAAGAGGGGGGGGAAVSDALVIAAPGTSQATMQTQTGVITAANLLDLWAGNGAGTVNGQSLAALRINSKIIAATAGANDAPLSDMFGNTVTGNIVGAIIPGGAGGTLTLSLASGQNPVVVEAYGKRQEALFGHVPTSNAISAAGIYTLLADVSGGTQYFGLVLTPGQVTSANNQLPLAILYYNGATFDTTALYYPGQPVVSGANFQPLHKSLVYADTAVLTTINAITQLPSTAALTFNAPTQGLTAHVRVFGNIVAPATTGDFRVYPGYSGGAGTALGNQAQYAKTLNQAASGFTPFSVEVDIGNLPSGPVNFGIFYFATVINYQIIFPTIVVDITR